MNGPRAREAREGQSERERERERTPLVYQRVTTRLGLNVSRFVREQTDLAVMATPGPGRQGYKCAQ